jgi:hypothetical protein
MLDSTPSFVVGIGGSAGALSAAVHGMRIQTNHVYVIEFTYAL